MAGTAAASVGEASGPALRIGARVGGNLALMLMPSELGDDQLELKKLQYRRANGLPWTVRPIPIRTVLTAA